MWMPKLRELWISEWVPASSVGPLNTQSQGETEAHLKGKVLDAWQKKITQWSMSEEYSIAFHHAAGL